MITRYHRPETIEEALNLLARKDNKTVILPSQLLTDARLDDSVEAVVDLQSIGLDQIEYDVEGLRIGALTRLQTLVERELVPELLREVAHQEAPSTFRNMQTIGSIILKSDPESRMLAALLALDAHLTVQTLSGMSEAGLTDFLAGGAGMADGGIITAILTAQDGQTATASVARTPADKPIVAAVGRRDGRGRIWFALSGVARTPVLIDPANIETLEPPGDFRGSSGYRKEMAMVLSQRVLNEIGSSR